MVRTDWNHLSIMPDDVFEWFPTRLATGNIILDRLKKSSKKVKNDQQLTWGGGGGGPAPIILVIRWAPAKCTADKALELQESVEIWSWRQDTQKIRCFSTFLCRQKVPEWINVINWRFHCLLVNFNILLTFKFAIFESCWWTLCVKSNKHFVVNNDVWRMMEMKLCRVKLLSVHDWTLASECWLMSLSLSSSTVILEILVS